MNKIEKQHLLKALENSSIRVLVKMALAIVFLAVLFSF